MIANKIPRMTTSTNDDLGSGSPTETQGRNTAARVNNRQAVSTSE